MSDHTDLRASLWSILEQLRLLALILDERGTIAFITPDACRLLGISDEEAAGAPWDRILRRLSTSVPAVGSESMDSTQRPHASEGSDGPAGGSPAMRVLRKLIHDVAPVDVTVLIEGETGTGKELVARAIHHASRRRDGPFIPVNPAGLTEPLLSSQLFGHRRGSFIGAISDHVGLFETAQGGTLFLDEIGDIPLGVQTHLLRVLQEREITRLGEWKPRRIDIRVIAATNRRLEEEVARGRFRQDLFYRVRVAQIVVPPLRDRAADIPQLAARLLEQVAAATGKDVRAISQPAMSALCQHAWPGNVRELRGAIEAGVLSAAGGVLQLTDLPIDITGHTAWTEPALTTGPATDRILEALRRAKGNRTLAARLLGISRTTLYRRLATLALDTLPSRSE